MPKSTFSMIGKRIKIINDKSFHDPGTSGVVHRDEGWVWMVRVDDESNPHAFASKGLEGKYLMFNKEYVKEIPFDPVEEPEPKE